jgi:hypothetical protein
MLIFLDKKVLQFFQKKFGTTEFYEKNGSKKNRSRFFFCHLMQNSVTLTRTSINLNHKWLSPTCRKSIWF